MLRTGCLVTGAMGRERRNRNEQNRTETNTSIVAAPALGEEMIAAAADEHISSRHEVWSRYVLESSRSFFGVVRGLYIACHVRAARTTAIGKGFGFCVRQRV